MMEKFAQFGEGGVHAHPLSLYLPSRTKYWWAEKAAHYPYFYSIPICTLWGMNILPPLKGGRATTTFVFLSSILFASTSLLGSDSNWRKTEN
jgi:hypothetical protein